MNSILQAMQAIDGLLPAEASGYVKWETWGCFSFKYVMRFELENKPWLQSLWIFSSKESLEQYLGDLFAPYAYPNTIPSADASKDRGNQYRAEVLLYVHEAYADILKYNRNDIRRDI